MKRQKINGIGIVQDDAMLFSDFEHDGEMWTGEGPRQMRLHVALDEGFSAPPLVTVGLTMWDTSHDANARMDVTAEDIRPDGFAIVFRTWGDTKVARVRVGWQAIGPVRDDELWEID